MRRTRESTTRERWLAGRSSDWDEKVGRLALELNENRYHFTHFALFQLLKDIGSMQPI
jgi:hypothetical protein